MDGKARYPRPDGHCNQGQYCASCIRIPERLTKEQYTTNYKRGAKDISIKVNYTGNNAKSLMVSVDASLKKLRTHYIDILYLHWWDWQSSIEEVMDSLHHLVALRKVLYLGVSDTPAWVVSYANAYAKAHGKTPFVIYQGAWNVMDRSFEREIIPMARTLGLALAPWNVLAGGRLRTDAEEEERMASGEKGRQVFGEDWKRNENEKKMSAALEKVAKEVGTKYITAVAIAYVMQKTPYVFPIIGGRKVEHLMANIDALKISLTDEQIQYLESVIPFDLGFPASFIVSSSPYSEERTQAESSSTGRRYTTTHNVPVRVYITVGPMATQAAHQASSSYLTAICAKRSRVARNALWIDRFVGLSIK